MNSPPKLAISVDAGVRQMNGQRYEAVLRLSEALSQCREPEDLTKILSEQLREFLEFLQFYIVVYKENSTEVEWAVVGREKSLVSAYADVPVEQRPSWQAYTTQEPFHIRDWNTDERVPAASRKELQLKGLTSGRWFLFPSPRHIAAWARWACPDTLGLLTAVMTLAFCDSLVELSHSRLTTISISAGRRLQTRNWSVRMRDCNAVNESCAMLSKPFHPWHGRPQQMGRLNSSTVAGWITLGLRRTKRRVGVGQPQFIQTI